MAIPSRIVPINYTSKFKQGDDTANYTGIPDSVIQSISMGIRFSDKYYAIGYIQKFGWSSTRDAKELYQIEPFPNGTFDTGYTLDANSPSFLESDYWPGEVMEIVPSKLGAIDIDLGRYVLYRSNLLSILMQIERAGTDETEASLPGPAVTHPMDGNATITEYNKYVTLIQQVRPIQIYQIYINPITGKPIFGRHFVNCWLTNLGETIPEANANEPIMEDGKAKATRIRPLPSAIVTGSASG